MSIFTTNMETACNTSVVHYILVHGYNDNDGGHQVEVPRITDNVEELLKEAKVLSTALAVNQCETNDWLETIDTSKLPHTDKILLKEVATVLDDDRLLRNAIRKMPNEVVRLRNGIDRSAERMEGILESVGIIYRKWVHGILMRHLPPSYLEAYLHILQTMNRTLVGGMVAPRQRCLAKFINDKWAPKVDEAYSGSVLSDTIFVVLPPMFDTRRHMTCLQKWYEAFATFSATVVLDFPQNICRNEKDEREFTECLSLVTTTTLQKLRDKHPSKKFVLVGFKETSSTALAIAAKQNVFCVICMALTNCKAFSLDAETPVLFVIGEGSNYATKSGMESLLKNMNTQSEVIVMGAADDNLHMARDYRDEKLVMEKQVQVMVLNEIQNYINRRLRSHCVIM